MVYHKEPGDGRPGQVVVCDVLDDFKEVERFDCPRGWDWAHLHFSPGGGKFLLVVRHTNKFVVLDSGTWEEVDWGAALRLLAMPPKRSGDWQSVRWVQPAAVLAGERDASPLMLQAVAGWAAHYRGGGGRAADGGGGEGGISLTVSKYCNRHWSSDV